MMKTRAKTWLAQIAVMLMLMASGMASGASGFLRGNSPLGKNAWEAVVHRAEPSLSGGTHRGCGDLKPQDAADLFVAPSNQPPRQRSLFPELDEPVAAPKVNLNSNDATGNFGLYEIKIKGQLYKYGKADLDRVTESSGLPTRLHQQVRKLREQHGQDAVTGEVVEELGQGTTKQAKSAEDALLQRSFDETGVVPPGNEKSFKPKTPK